MKENNIIRLGLESQVAELKAQGKSEQEIADALSNDSNHITKSSIHRYLVSQSEIHKEVIEKKEKLQAQLVQAELDTIQIRHETLQELKDIAREARDKGDLRAAINALDKVIASLDIVFCGE